MSNTARRAAAALVGAGVLVTGTGAAEAASIERLGFFSSEADLPAGWSLSTTTVAGSTRNLIAEARIGDAGGAATFELDVGGSTSNASEFTQAQFAWADGATYGFELKLVGPTATWTMNTGGTPTAVSFAFGAVDAFNGLLFRLAVPSDDPDDRVTLGDLTLGGAAVAEDPAGLLPYTHRQAPADGRAVWLGLLAGMDLSQGFTLAGTLTFDWDDTMPKNSHLAMQIKGASVVETPSTAPVPVPAALPLLASALAGLGFLGWRRRQAA